MDTMIPKEEIRQRAENLRKMLAAANLDGALFHYALDVYYFSGTRH